MTKPLFQDLTYNPNPEAECSPAMREWLQKLGAPWTTGPPKSATEEQPTTEQQGEPQ
jgi:hypothetical protein